MSASIELAIRELQPGRFAELLVATRTPHGGWMNSVPLPLPVWRELLDEMDRHLAAGESYTSPWEITGESLILEIEPDGSTDDVRCRVLCCTEQNGQPLVEAEIRLRGEALREALRGFAEPSGPTGRYLHLHDAWEPDEAVPQPRLVVSVPSKEDVILLWEGGEVVASASLPEKMPISRTAWQEVLDAGLNSFRKRHEVPLQQWTIIIEKEVAPGLMCTVGYGALPSAHFRSGPLHELPFQTQPILDVCLLVLEEEPDGEAYWDWIAQYRCDEAALAFSLGALAQGRIELYSS